MLNLNSIFVLTVAHFKTIKVGRISPMVQIPLGAIYAGLLEMPQKVCGGCILHVMAYAFVFEMPQNHTYSFSVLFSFSNRLNRFDFGAFQKMHMLSRVKYHLHILFRAFQATPVETTIIGKTHPTLRPKLTK